MKQDWEEVFSFPHNGQVVSLFTCGLKQEEAWIG